MKQTKPDKNSTNLNWTKLTYFITLKWNITESLWSGCSGPTLATAKARRTTGSGVSARHFARIDNLHSADWTVTAAFVDRHYKLIGLLKEKRKISVANFKTINVQK